MRQVDRRALFTSGVAAALLAATGVSLDAAPKRGGKLRIAVPKGGAFEDVMARAVFDGLTEVGPDGILRGELAADWHSDAQARVWVFTLRDGVRFHDGAPVGAGDVAAMLTDRGLEARADGPLTVQITLAASNPHLPFDLAGPGWLLRRADGVGTGLYRVAELREGRHFIGDRMMPHYKDGDAGWPDRIELITIPDARVRAEALRDGYVDVASMLDAPDLAQLDGLQFHPSRDEATIAAHMGVGLPRTISARAALDDGRIAERWWLA